MTLKQEIISFWKQLLREKNCHEGNELLKKVSQIRIKAYIFCKRKSFDLF